LATVTGPNRQSAGTTGAKNRGEPPRPGTSKIGIVLSMLVSGSGKNFVKIGWSRQAPD